jgi:hypothetical protein
MKVGPACEGRKASRISFLNGSHYKRGYEWVRRSQPGIYVGLGYELSFRCGKNPLSVAETSPCHSPDCPRRRPGQRARRRSMAVGGEKERLHMIIKSANKCVKFPLARVKDGGNPGRDE